MFTFRVELRIISSDNSFGCSVFLGKSIDWNIEDPKGKPIEKVRQIRDNIEEKIKELCKTLE
jgi:protein-tyrosine-phosphatase